MKIIGNGCGQPDSLDACRRASVSSSITMLALLMLAAAPSGYAATSREGAVETNAPAYVLGVFTTPHDNLNEANGFGNTGLAYDAKHNLLAMGRYNNGIAETIEFVDRSGRRALPPIDVSAHVFGIQGLAYDSSDDTFWVWGGDVAKNPDRKAFRAEKPEFPKIILHVDRQGRRLPDSIPFHEYPGTLTYDAKADALWVRPNGGYWIYCLACKDGALIEKVESRQGGEGLALDPFDGTFWLLSQTQIHHLQKRAGKMTTLASYPNPSLNYPADVAQFSVTGTDFVFKPEPKEKKTIITSFSGGFNKVPRGWNRVYLEGEGKVAIPHEIMTVTNTELVVSGLVTNTPKVSPVTIRRYIRGADEGLVVDPQDHTLWFNADQWIHGGIPGGNRCWHVNPMAYKPEQ